MNPYCNPYCMIPFNNNRQYINTNNTIDYAFQPNLYSKPNYEYLNNYNSFGSISNVHKNFSPNLNVHQIYGPYTFFQNPIQNTNMCPVLGQPLTNWYPNNQKNVSNLFSNTSYCPEIRQRLGSSSGQSSGQYNMYQSNFFQSNQLNVQNFTFLQTKQNAYHQNLTSATKYSDKNCFNSYNSLDNSENSQNNLTTCQQDENYNYYDDNDDELKNFANETLSSDNTLIQENEEQDMTDIDDDDDDDEPNNFANQTQIDNTLIEENEEKDIDWIEQAILNQLDCNQQNVLTETKAKDTNDFNMVETNLPKNNEYDHLQELCNIVDKIDQVQNIDHVFQQNQMAITTLEFTDDFKNHIPSNSSSKTHNLLRESSHDATLDDSTKTEKEIQGNNDDSDGVNRNKSKKSTKNINQKTKSKTKNQKIKSAKTEGLQFTEGLQLTPIFYDVNNCKYLDANLLMKLKKEILKSKKEYNRSFKAHVFRSAVLNISEFYYYRIRDSKITCLNNIKVMEMYKRFYLWKNDPSKIAKFNQKIEEYKIIVNSTTRRSQRIFEKNM